MTLRATATERTGQDIQMLTTSLLILYATDKLQKFNSMYINTDMTQCKYLEDNTLYLLSFQCYNSRDYIKKTAQKENISPRKIKFIYVYSILFR